MSSSGQVHQGSGQGSDRSGTMTLDPTLTANHVPASGTLLVFTYLEPRRKVWKKPAEKCQRLVLNT